MKKRNTLILVGVLCGLSLTSCILGFFPASPVLVLEVGESKTFWVMYNHYRQIDGVWELEKCGPECHSFKSKNATWTEGNMFWINECTFEFTEAGFYRVVAVTRVSGELIQFNIKFWYIRVFFRYILCRVVCQDK